MIKKLKQQLEEKDKELVSQLVKTKKLDSQLASKEEEISSQLAKTKKINSQMAKKEKEIEQLQKELEDLKKEVRKEKREKSKMESIENKNFRSIEILDSESMKDYETIEKIGFGSSSTVYKVASKKYFAMKIMNSKNANVKNIRHFIGEYEIMNILNHPNILKAFGIFFGDEENPPAILLEHCPTNVFDAIKNNELSNVQIACAIYQIAEGMKYLHYKKIIHRDLKPSNILIESDGTIKISDFGISKLMTHDELSMTIGVGTNKFMAPELVLEEDDYNEKIDVYSFGVLVYFILNNGELPKIKMGQIIKGVKAEIPSSFSEFSTDLINSCWNLDPNDRPSFKKICNQMESNDFKLLTLTKSEERRVKAFVQNHQKLLP